VIRNWISLANKTIASIVVLLIIGAATLYILRSDEITTSDAILNKRPLPAPAFAFKPACYEEIGKAGCHLKFAPMTLQLPDLRNHLVYYGKNGRPDAQSDRVVLHFGFSNNNTPFTLASGERAYLKYDRQKNPPQYVHSPEETPLWIEAALNGNDANVTVRMRDENGDIIDDPFAHAQFSLPEKEAVRTGGKVWEMGKWRVDGSLLARQKARWMGKDCFLEAHGGEEYKNSAEKHRIDFTDDETCYSIFVGLNDTIIWKDDRWKVVQPGDESRGHPMMLIKKVDERLMNCELWDVGGKQKIPLTLIKVNETWPHQKLQEKFKFLGARTRSQYIFEIDGQRMLLSPKDWLLQTQDEGWVKLITTQQIDDYVDRKLIGVLFVFDGLMRDGDKQFLKGIMYNAARTDTQELEIAVQQGANGRTGDSEHGKQEDDDDNDDDDFFMDDDDDDDFE